MPTAIKISAPDWCFLKAGIEPAKHYAKLKTIGYDAVEMVAPENRAAAVAAGLKVLNLSAPGMGKGLNHRENHGELLPAIGDYHSHTPGLNAAYAAQAERQAVQLFAANGP